MRAVEGRKRLLSRLRENNQLTCGPKGIPLSLPEKGDGITEIIRNRVKPYQRDGHTLARHFALRPNNQRVLIGGRVFFEPILATEQGRKSWRIRWRYKRVF
jgi:hypothetical protein